MHLDLDERGPLLFVVVFEEEFVDHEGGSDHGTLLRRTGLLRKVDDESVRVGEYFGHEGLWLFEDLSQVGSIAVGVFEVGIVKAEGCLATTFSAGVSLGAVVDAHASAAGRRVHLVHGLFVVVVEDESRDAAIKLFLDGTKLFSATCKGGFLVTAALATTNGTSQGTIDRNQFGLGVQFLDCYFEGANHGAAKSHEEIGLLEGRGDLIVTDQVLELALGFAAHYFLAPTATGLTNLHLLDRSDVRLQSVGPAVHGSFFFGG